MKEDFLHYVWQFKKFDFLNVKTTEGQAIQLFKTGIHNETESGPDFLDARLKIGEQKWAGNVEIHLKSSDWYAHHHEKDPAYDNVILHVVWLHDVNVFRKTNAPIPTLVLKDKVYKTALKNYRNLMAKEARWINCQQDFKSFSSFKLNNWLERLYIERLEDKSKVIKGILQKTTNNWEATLFCMLAKNFGLNINGDSFLSLALGLPFSVVRKIRDAKKMEALLFGHSGLLNPVSNDAYAEELKTEYRYLKHKYKLTDKGVLPIRYFRLRPQNFPTVRLAQLAVLLTVHKNLFKVLIEEGKLEKIRKTFAIKASNYWDKHYSFGKKTKSSPKKLSKGFVDLVLINTIVPLKFCYMQSKGNIALESLLAFIRQLPAERNNIVQGYNKLRTNTAQNALDSQALIQLKKNYCDKNRCLHCNLGLELLQNRTT